jgi:NAD/NADP transhydrogenase beta subunit
MPDESVPRSSATSRPWTFWALACAAASMVIGGFGPWATVLGVASVSGTNGDGWFLIIGGAIAGGMLARDVSTRSTRRWPMIVALLVALVGLAVTIVDVSDISGTASGTILADAVSPGWGIYLALVGSLGAAAVALVALRIRPYATAEAPSTSFEEPLIPVA